MSGLPIRPDLAGEEPYGAPQVDAPVRLNTNESPFPPGPNALRAIVAALTRGSKDIQRYPDRDARDLRAALATYVTGTTARAVGPDMIWPANGSNEVLQQLLLVFAGAGRTALAFEPTYSMHHKIATTTGTGYAVRPRGPGFAIDVDDAIREIGRRRPGVVLLCTPNNPTGGSTAPADIERLYEAVEQGPEGVLIVDEAYAEFSDCASAIDLMVGRPRLVVVRTMSKALSFAGGRVGYMVAHPSAVAAVQLVRLPYHLSTLTQAAAIAALEHADEANAGMAEIRSQRNRILRFALDHSLPVGGGDANFVLLGGLGDSKRVWGALLDRGVLVRDVGLEGWLRVTAGTETETSTFLDALSDILGVSPHATDAQVEMEEP